MSETDFEMEQWRKPQGELYSNDSIDEAVKELMMKINPRSYKRLMKDLQNPEEESKPKTSLVDKIISYFKPKKTEKKNQDNYAISKLEDQVENKLPYKPLNPTQLKRNELKSLLYAVSTKQVITQIGEYITTHKDFIIPRNGGISIIEQEYNHVIDSLVNEMPDEEMLNLINSANDFDKHKPYKYPGINKYVSQNIVLDLDSKLDAIKKYVGNSSGYKPGTNMQPAMVN